MTEDQKMHIVMKAYADLVHGGVEENVACHLFISCGLSLLANCCCTDHLAAEYAIVEKALAEAKAEITPRAN